MSDLILQSSQPLALPLPSVNVTTRPGVLSDVPFLDSLQKLHTKQVGWMPTAQFEGTIKLGHVLIAESNGEPVLRRIALNQLQREKTLKGGIKTKRLKAGWDHPYLLKVLTG